MNAVPYITYNKFLKALRDSASLASHGRLIHDSTAIAKTVFEVICSRLRDIDFIFKVS